MQFIQKAIPVRHAYIPPHFRVAGGDAREIAEAPRRVAEQLRRVGAPGDVADQRIRKQVRQVAHRGEHFVVLFGRHARHARAKRRPQAGNGFDVFLFIFIQRRKDKMTTSKQFGAGRGGAAALGPGDGMRRHEPGDRLAEASPRRGDHVALGASGIHDQRIRLQVGTYFQEYFLVLRHRGRQQHEVRVAHRALRVD